MAKITPAILTVILPVESVYELRVRNDSGHLVCPHANDESPLDFSFASPDEAVAFLDGSPYEEEAIREKWILVKMTIEPYGNFAFGSSREILIHAKT